MSIHEYYQSLDYCVQECRKKFVEFVSATDFSSSRSIFATCSNYVNNIAIYESNNHSVFSSAARHVSSIVTLIYTDKLQRVACSFHFCDPST